MHDIVVKEGERERGEDSVYVVWVILYTLPKCGVKK